MKKKDIIHISIGLILAIIIGFLFNYFGNNQLKLDSLISWILAGAMLIIFMGIIVCSFLLGKPLSKVIEL